MEQNQKPSEQTQTTAKKQTGIPSSSIPTRLPTSTSVRKSTGIPSAVAATPTPSQSSADAVLKTSTSSASLHSNIKHSASSAKISNENEQPVLVAEDAGSDKEAVKMRNTIKDLTEKLETLKLKRAEDREKLREYEKSKIQIQQLQEFKTKAQEIISELNKDLQVSKQETKAAKDNYEAYKEEMANHEQRIEEMAVDKELAEAKSEELQDEIEKLNDKLEELKLELDVLKGEIELNGTEGAAASFQSKQSEKEQERLKAALIKLRDLSIQDKNEIASLRKQNDELQQKQKSLLKENDTLKSENNSNLVQINELKDQITATLGSVQIIEQLTEQNLDLETKIIELRETIADLEAINDVNDQLQESAHEEERELRKNLDLAESRIREFEKEIEFLKYKIADHEKTIVKFRELVQQLQNEKDVISRKMQTRIDELQSKLNSFAANSSSQSISSFDFKQKLMETKNLAKIVENELNKIDIQNLKKYNAYLLTFMSDQFLKRSGDHECLLTILFFKRIICKSDLLLNQIREKYSNLFNNNGVKTNGADQSEFVFEILMILTHIKLLCNKYDYVLGTSSLKVYSNIGSMFFDFNSHEKVLDLMIDLLQKDQLDENKKNFELAEKMCIHLQSIFKNHLIDEKFDEIKFLEDLVKFGTFSCESISTYLFYLNSIIKDDQTEIVQLLKELSCNNEELKIFLKKALKLIPKEEASGEKRIVLSFPTDLQNQLENCVNNFYMVSKSLKELYNLASNTSVSQNSGDTIEGNLSAKKLEDLAYQACDKIYLIDDNGPYENLRNSINELHNTFKKTISGLENGEYEKELNEEEFKIRKYMINSPALIASEQFKNALLEAESIKYKLETKEDEIREIKRTLKIKIDELSEYKLRISINENKSENALKESEEKNKKLGQSIEELKAASLKKEKEHTETIEAMQQEIETYENEIRDLKKKVPKKLPFSTQSSSEALTPKSPISSNLSFVESPLLIQEIKLAKTINKFLEKNNYELKKSLAETMLTNLPALPQLTKLDLTSNGGIKDENLSKLYKQSNDLIKNLYSSLANVKVQELNLSKSKSIKKNSIANTDVQEKIQMKQISFAASQIQNKIMFFQSELLKSKGATGATQQARGKIEKKMIAEICLPCGSDKGKTIDLSLNYDEIKEILRNI